jgi:Domain of unknown function (DUF222)
MSSIAWDEAVIAFKALADQADEPAELWSTPQRLAWLDNVETLARILPALQHQPINDLLAQATTQQVGGSLQQVLADRLRIYRRDAARRIEEAADLGARSTLIGQPLPPKLEHTAAGQRAGLIGVEQVAIIRTFFDRLPCWIDEPTRAQAEDKLAQVAANYRPDELQRFADWYAAVLNPDGDFSDADRARKRGVTIGAQGRDGMSAIKGWLNPELRSGLDAIFAKLAAPGMCNPAEENPTIEGEASQQAIDADCRSAAQRNHDALNAMARSTLMSGELGSHQGVPVTIVATVSLADLQAKAGVATTGGGSWLPMTDVIRMAAHADNFLLIFDDAKPLQLYKGRTTRLATPAQRLVLYATERGCSHPGCDVPACWCQAHHAEKDWAAGGQTNIDELTLACGPHNRKVTKDGWKTRKRQDGTTEWIPTPHLDHGQRRTNTYFHPERMLPDDEDDEPH